MGRDEGVMGLCFLRNWRGHGERFSSCPLEVANELADGGQDLTIEVLKRGPRD